MADGLNRRTGWIPQYTETLTQNGAKGYFYSIDPSEFIVGAKASIHSNTKPTLWLTISGIDLSSGLVNVLGPDSGYDVDLSVYTVTDSAVITLVAQWVTTKATPVELASQTTPIVVTTRSLSTPEVPTSVTIGVVSTSVVGANPDRRGIILINTSSNTISLGFGSDAILNSGITLVPLGSFSMDEYSFTTGAINAIASGAGSNLAIQEFM